MPQIQLKPHQQRVADNPLPYYLDTSLPGTGKTFTQIAWAVARSNDTYFNLVVLPKAIAASTKKRRVNPFGQYGKSINDYCGSNDDRPFQVFDGTTRHTIDYETINALLDMEISVWLIVNPATLSYIPFLKEVVAITKAGCVNTLILDESHLYKNPSANQTKFATLLSLHFEYRMLGTATPYETLVSDLYCQLRILQPGVYSPRQGFSTEYQTVQKLKDADAQEVLEVYGAKEGASYSYAQFEHEFTQEVYNHQWQRVRRNRPHAVDEILGKIAGFNQTIQLEDVRSDLPDVTYDFKMIDGSKEVLDIAKFMRRTLGQRVRITMPERRMDDGTVFLPSTEVEIRIKNKAALSVRLRQLAGIHGGKFEELLRMHPNPTEDNQIVVMCQYKSTARMIAKHYGVVPLVGTINITDAHKRQRVIVGTTAKLSTGISLGWIKDLIIISPGYSSIQRRQMLERLRRADSTDGDIKITFLVSTFVIDAEILAKVDGKMIDIKAWNQISSEMAQNYNLQVDKE